MSFSSREELDRFVGSIADRFREYGWSCVVSEVTSRIGPAPRMVFDHPYSRESGMMVTMDYDRDWVVRHTVDGHEFGAVRSAYVRSIPEEIGQLRRSCNKLWMRKAQFDEFLGFLENRSLVDPSHVEWLRESGLPFSPMHEAEEREFEPSDIEEHSTLLQAFLLGRPV